MGSHRDPMTMVAFLQASNCSNYTGSWRHPLTRGNFLSAEYYQDIARTLEQGKFQLVFMDDRLALPDIYGNDTDAAVRHGIRPIKLDLTAVLSFMAAATRSLGLGATYSTTYYNPFHIARTFATLDHLTGGRAAWNIVTSLNDAEAHNFGYTEHGDHDLRYDKADEFLEVVTGLWDSWEQDAIVYARGEGTFADPAKVHRLNHAGKWFQCRGPLTVPRCPQGHPVLIQAGQSGRGRKFAGRWGELIFVLLPNLEMARDVYRDIKAAAQAVGRDRNAVRVLPAVYVVTAETENIARDKAQFIESLAHPMDTLILLSELANHDFSKYELDEPLSEKTLATMSGAQSLRDRVVRMSGKASPTLRDFMTFSGRGTLQELPRFVGSPGKIADQFEEWLDAEACDGFVLAATHMPGSYEDFVRLVVPELQERGLHQADYAGATLRENLRLARPGGGSQVR